MNADDSRQHGVSRKSKVNPEKIAYWFFRLNGCFTFENFIVHPDEAGGQRTDADLIALRFLDRRELLTSRTPMRDHVLFEKQQARMALYFVEVKTGRCELNGPWTDPQRHNLERVLNALGVVPQSKIEEVANSLYRELHASQNDMDVRFVAVGRAACDRLLARGVPQLTWSDLLLWIHGRFRDYERQKEDHRQWEELGKRLYSKAVRHPATREPAAYVAHWMRQMGIVPEIGNASTSGL